MPSAYLSQFLSDLCGGQGWTYTVFWKIQKKLASRSARNLASRNKARDAFQPNDWCLVWENGRLSDVSQVAESWTGLGDSIHGSIDYGLLSNCYRTLLSQVHPYGKGLIGSSIINGIPEWIQKEQNFHLMLDSLPSGWNTHFAAGIKTILVIPVPGGALQLASIHDIAKSERLVQSLARRFCILPGVSRASNPHAKGPPCPVNNQSKTQAEPLQRLESSDSSGAMDTGKFAALKFESSKPSYNESHRTSQLSNGGFCVDYPAICTFKVTKDEQRLVDMQFKILASDSMPAVALEKSLKQGSSKVQQNAPVESKSTLQSKKRPYEVRSAPEQKVQPCSEQQSGQILSLVHQLNYDRWQSLSRQLPDMDLQKSALTTETGLQAHNFHPVKACQVSGSPPSGLGPHLSLVERLKTIDAQQKLGLLSAEAVAAMVSSIEEEAIRMGLIDTSEREIKGSPVGQSEKVSEVVPEVNSSHSALLEDEDFWAGFEIDDLQPPPAKKSSRSHFLIGTDVFYSGSGEEEEGWMSSVVEEKMDEIRQIIPSLGNFENFEDFDSYFNNNSSSAVDCHGSDSA